LSSDGINWTHYSRIIYNSITYTWNRHRFDYMSQYNILVGTCVYNSIYYICYSSDAINWTVTINPLYNNMYNFISVPQLNISIFYSTLTSRPYCPFLTFDYNEYINNYDINYNLTNLNKQLIPNNTLVTNAISNYYTRTNLGNYNFTSICWCPRYLRFITAATDTTYSVNSSSNGINWEGDGSAIFKGSKSVCWSPELPLFVAVLFSGTDGSRVATSPTGSTNWTLRTTPANNDWTSICWSPDLLLFVAVASSGTGNRIMISPNGINWSSIVNPVDNNWTSVCWAKYLGLFVAVASSGTGNRVMTSSDGITWTSRTSATNNDWTSICYNSYSNLLVAVAASGSGNRVMTSSDGINWTSRTTPSNDWRSVCWSPEFDVFLAVASSGTGDRVMTSFDGINWTSRTSAADNYWTSVCWSPELNMFAAVASSGNNNRIMTTLPVFPHIQSSINTNGNTINVNQNNGYVGLGTQTPTFRLQLSTNSASKPSTSTWTVSSDERLKNNIVDADIDMCYNNIKNLKLKRYTWKDEVYTNDQVSDRSKLGWIAQEVETVFPKAVEKHFMHGYEDCRTLNSDQIIASMYGCLQKLINIYDNQTNELNLLDTNLSKLQNTVDELTK